MVPEKMNLKMNFLVWIPWHVSDFESHRRLINPTDFIVVKLITSTPSKGKEKYHPTKNRQQKNQPNKQTNTKTTVTTKYKETNRKEKQNKLYIPCPMLSWKVLSGIILLRWHQQVRLTFLNIIIKWCQMRQASTLLWSLLRITRKTHDTRT